MVTRELFVEGGGNSALATECRKAFAKLFTKAGIKQKPRVVACGGRQSAYEQFCEAHSEGVVEVWLLVDAEEIVATGPPFDPWKHVRNRKGDEWERPDGATDDQLHLMAVCTETWLHADHDAIAAVFGQKLDKAKLLPEGSALEQRPKPKVYAALDTATKRTDAGAYGKGHAFKVLERVSPVKLGVLSWAQRLLVELAK